jgi:hypothetical protein
MKTDPRLARNNPPALSSGRMGELHSRPFANPPAGCQLPNRASPGESGESSVYVSMVGHLDNARLELRQVLERHQGSCELDALTSLVLEAFRAITAARRVAVAIDNGPKPRRLA